MREMMKVEDETRWENWFTNKEYLSILNDICLYFKELSEKNNFIDYFTPHDTSHSFAVEKMLKAIIGRCEIQLTEPEKFVLFISAWTHDIGMLEEVALYFLDEDYSGGWHQTSYNAFAYHCAINEEDVIDSGDEDASNIYVNDHVEYDLDTINNTNYVWELAITVYDDTFNESNPENTTVTLNHNKEMGIAVAYCDNDGGSQRENFI